MKRCEDAPKVHCESHQELFSLPLRILVHCHFHKDETDATYGVSHNGTQYALIRAGSRTCQRCECDQLLNLLDTNCQIVMNKQRQSLDQLFALDAVVSVVFGSLALFTPHGIFTFLSEGSYNHAVHETVR